MTISFPFAHVAFAACSSLLLAVLVGCLWMHVKGLLLCLKISHPFEHVCPRCLCGPLLYVLDSESTNCRVYCNHLFRSFQLDLFLYSLIEYLLVYVVHQLKSGGTSKKWDQDSSVLTIALMGWISFMVRTIIISLLFSRLLDNKYEPFSNAYIHKQRKA